MHKENLNFLYDQYRNCLKSELYNYLAKDDEYKSYEGHCHIQKKDIHDYIDIINRKADYTNPGYETDVIRNNWEKMLVKFRPFGWSEKHIRN